MLVVGLRRKDASNEARRRVPGWQNAFGEARRRSRHRWVAHCGVCEPRAQERRLDESNCSSATASCLLDAIATHRANSPSVQRLCAGDPKMAPPPICPTGWLDESSGILCLQRPVHDIDIHEPQSAMVKRLWQSTDDGEPQLLVELRSWRIAAHHIVELHG